MMMMMMMVMRYDVSGDEWQKDLDWINLGI